MTSFNHYALGAVADFLHRVVAGLAPIEPGYARVRIAPQPGGGLGRAKVRHDSPHGTIECGWTRSEGRLDVRVVLPEGVTADIEIPGLPSTSAGAGTHEFSVDFRDPEDDPQRPRRWNIHIPKNAS